MILAMPPSLARVASMSSGSRGVPARPTARRGRTARSWSPVPGTGAAQPADRLAELGDRVVGVGHGTVAGGALHGQPHPVHALLGRLDQVEPQVLVDGEREAADLADRLGDPLEQPGCLSTR
ncbi:ArgE Acetylornithine deacetylase/Succinyl-diaminopimelate desuccinylase [Pyrenophora tritici-repentis]|nr:ArgE Acetylornithine deacetylase/Succinyl-diaminopimelate desuccinylase [Pyrenophora tritici-repentis]